MRTVRMMGLCLVLLFASVNDMHAADSDTEICSSIAKEARYIMEKRQEGISKEKTGLLTYGLLKDDDPSHQDAIKGIVDYAYFSPIQHTQNSKDRYSLIFELVFYGLCMESRKEK